MTKPAFPKAKDILLCLALLPLYACSGGDGVTGAGVPGTGNEDATDGGSWLAGDWKGNYKNKEAEEGSALRETSATAKFTAADGTARTGDFELQLPLLNKVSVKGTYHDFQGKSLLLEIKESNLSTIGAPNTSTELNYSLVGDALELYNDRIQVRLVRGEGQPDGEDAEDPNKDPVINDWLCRDGNAFDWKFELSETSFSVDVYDPSGERGSVWMKGETKITRGTTDADAVLTVTSAQFDKYKGLELRANTVNKEIMNLRRMVVGQDGQKGVQSVMECRAI